MTDLSEKDIKLRIGITPRDLSQKPIYPHYTIEGNGFSTSQTRRKLPVSKRGDAKYWYTMTGSNRDSVDKTTLDAMVKYVEDKLIGGSKSSATTSTTKKEDKS